MSDHRHHLFSAPPDEQELKDRVATGHSYFVLRDDVPDEDLIFLSEYLNSGALQLIGFFTYCDVFEAHLEHSEGDCVIRLKLVGAGISARTSGTTFPPNYIKLFCCC